MVKVSLGCGKYNMGDDWVHVDGAKYPHVFSHDVAQLPFKTNSCDLLYASHLIAYFDQYEIKSVLKEWRRVLKKGGTLRIATPNFNVLSSLIIYNNASMKDILGPLYGRLKTDNGYIYHKCCYNFFSLQSVLREAGFKDIKTYDWRGTSHFYITDCQCAYWPHRQKNIDRGYFDHDQILISLNMEAVK